MWLYSKHCLSQQIQERGWKQVEKHYADVFTNPLRHSEISLIIYIFIAKIKPVNKLKHEPICLLKAAGNVY